MLERAKNCAATAVGLASAFQDGAIARANRQGSDLHHSVGARFKNHPDHTKGNADALEHKPLIKGPVQLPLSEWVSQLGQLPYASNRPIKLGAIELETGEQGRSQLFLLGRFTVCLIGLQDQIALLLQGFGHGQQCLLALLIDALRQINGMTPQA